MLAFANQYAAGLSLVTEFGVNALAANYAQTIGHGSMSFAGLASPRAASIRARTNSANETYQVSIKSRSSLPTEPRTQSVRRHF